MSAGLLESARNILAGVLDLGRTRFELFSTELREELTRLAATIIGGFATILFAAIGLAFGAVALILSGASGPVPAVMFICAFAISAGAVFGRYHYAADALAGWAVALAVFFSTGR